MSILTQLEEEKYELRARIAELEQQKSRLIAKLEELLPILDAVYTLTNAVKIHNVIHYTRDLLGDVKESGMNDGCNRDH